MGLAPYSKIPNAWKIMDHCNQTSSRYSVTLQLGTIKIICHELLSSFDSS